jgi:hypothetical protein
MKLPIRTAAIAALAVSALAIPAIAQTRVATAGLPSPAVIRIPASAAVPFIPVNTNAPIMNGEYSTAIRIPADRIRTATNMRAQRAADAARFATGAGAGVSVQLRRSRY